MLRFTPGLLEDAHRRYVVLVPKAHLELFIYSKKTAEINPSRDFSFNLRKAWNAFVVGHSLLSFPRISHSLYKIVENFVYLRIHK